MSSSDSKDQSSCLGALTEAVHEEPIDIKPDTRYTLANGSNCNSPFPFVCDVCFDEFEESEAYIAHNQFHTDRNAYTDEDKPQSFSICAISSHEDSNKEHVNKPQIRTNQKISKSEETVVDVSCDTPTPSLKQKHNKAGALKQNCAKGVSENKMKKYGEERQHAVSSIKSRTGNEWLELCNAYTDEGKQHRPSIRVISSDEDSNKEYVNKPQKRTNEKICKSVAIVVDVSCNTPTPSLKQKNDKAGALKQNYAKDSFENKRKKYEEEIGQAASSNKIRTGNKWLELCNNYFPEMKKHMLASNNSSKCTTCERKFFSQQALKKHILWAHLKIIYCRVCYVQFEETEERQTHMRLEHPHICMQCDRAFSGRETLQYHIAVEHEVNSVICKICNKSFKTLSLLACHEKRVHQERARKWKCKQCDKAYLDNKYLNRHIATSHCTTKVPCSKCGKLYKSMFVLKSHERTSHSNLTYSCSICAKVYNSYGGHKVCEDRHNGIKRYKCDLCDKAYNAPSSLIVHKRIHTGEKPYSCWMCDRQFYTAQILLKHTLSHGITVEQFRIEQKRRLRKV